MESAQVAGEGAGTLESAADARWAHDVRIRALSRRSHAPDSAARWRRRAWLVALVLHVVLVVALRRSVPPPVVATAEQAIEVDLLALPAALPPEPEPPAKPAARAAGKTVAPRLRPAPIDEPARVAAPIEPLPLEEPRLFAADGTAMIPDDMAAQLDRERRRTGFGAQDPAPSPLFARKRPLKVRPNHFAQYWDGTDSMPLHDRIWRYVTATHEFTAPWGGRWKCAYVLMIVACADVPDKPWIPPQTWKPATELDEE